METEVTGLLMLTIICLGSCTQFVNHTKVPLLISTETFSTLNSSFNMEDTFIQSTKPASMPSHMGGTNKETMKTSIYILGQSTEEETLSSTAAGLIDKEDSKEEVPRWVETSMWIIEHFGGFALIVLGIPGNIFAVIILARPSLYALSGTFFLLVMTIADIFYIFAMQFLGTLLLRLWEIDLVVMNDWACRILSVLFEFSATMSKFSLLGFTIERFVSISCPLRSRLHFSRMSRILYLLGLALVLTGIGLADFFTLKVEKIMGYPECNFAMSLPMLNFRLGVSLALNFIPGIGMAVCNIGIIVLLTRQRSKVKYMKRKTSDADVKGITTMLLTITFAYIILTTPLYINNMVINQGSHGYELGILSNLFGFFYDLNHAINVILYLFSGATFRAETKAVIKQIFKRCQGKGKIDMGESGTAPQLRSTKVKDTTVSEVPSV